MERYVFPPPIEALRETLKKLPGIGPRSALRLVQHLMRHPELLTSLAGALSEVAAEVDACPACGFWKEKSQPLCPICTDPRRDEPALCVVREVSDLIAIEQAGAFRGHYHVLGGVLDPLAGISEKDLRLNDLWRRLREGTYQEVILALGTSPEAETTAYYIVRALSDWPGKVTRFPSGIPVGTDLSYVDTLTLVRSLRNRQPFQV